MAHIDLPDGAPGIMALVGTVAAANFLGLNGGYVAATTSAKVTIDTNASLTATRDVTLESYATETAANPAMSLLSLSPLGASVVVARGNSWGFEKTSGTFSVSS